MSKQLGHIAGINFVNTRSFRKLGIDFDEHLNVIVGASDSGKSNIVRTIRSVCENDSFDSMARTGSLDTGATIEFHGEECVSLRKRDGATKENGYSVRLAGEQSIDEYTAVGRAVPDEVAETLAMGVVSLGGEQVNLNIAAQRGPVLGVDDSPARLARIVGAVSGLDILFRASRKAESEQRKARTAIKLTQDIFDDLKEKYRAVKSTSNIAVLTESLREAERLSAVAQVAYESACELEGAIDDLRTSGEEVKGASDRLGELRGSSLSLESEYLAASGVVQSYRELERAVAELEAAHAGAIAESNRLAGLREEASAAGAEYERVVAALPVCPLCGAEREVQ